MRFAWTPASGQPLGYFVLRSLNGGAFQTYAYTAEPKIEIPVTAGDQISIRVSAAGYDSTGAYKIGPQSLVSDRVIVQRAPVFAATGSWLLRCATCPSLMRRSLSDASLVLAQARGLIAPWRILGVAQLQYGRDQILWNNATTGLFSIWDGQFLAEIQGLASSGPAALRGVEATDFDRDGMEEFVTQGSNSDSVAAWGVDAGLFKQVGALTGPAGARLAATKDFDGNGRIDLLWHNPVAGTLDLWLLNKDPTAYPLTVAISRVLRVASGLPSTLSVAATGDYDGDGNTDVLWRYTDGRFAISYLVAGVTVRYVVLYTVSGDLDRRVIGSVDIGGTAGDEIALQDTVTGLITILDPSPSGANTRTAVVHPGSEWRVVGIGS